MDEDGTHLPAASQVHGFITEWQPASFFFNGDEMINMNDMKCYWGEILFKIILNIKLS